jgi:histidyl-tRNA synthetase
MGLERLVKIIENAQCAINNDVDLFIAVIGDIALQTAEKLAYNLRKNGKSAQIDLCGRSVKAQMKYADKIGAKYSIVLGDDEVKSGVAALKNMQTGEGKEVNLEDLCCFDMFEIT